MRFGMRSRTADPSTRADLYAAAIDMCAWAEDRGAVTAVFSQHHGVDDGYLPSPVPLAAAVAARTRYASHPGRRSAVGLLRAREARRGPRRLDLISRGRVSYVVGIGYRAEEFTMFGIDRRGPGDTGGGPDRPAAGSGPARSSRSTADGPRDAAAFHARGPLLAYGGGTAAAARRAGRLGMLFLAEKHDATLEVAYRADGGQARRVASSRRGVCRGPSSSPRIPIGPGPNRRVPPG